MRVLTPFVLLFAAIGTVLWLDDPLPEADIVIANRGDAFTLDPQRMTYLRDFRIAYALYEGLVRWDTDDFSIIPAAAAALPTISDDGRTYTFAIRPEARWSNGDPVTAHDFVYSFQRLLLPDTASYYSSMMFVIDGAREFFDWRSAQLAAFASGDTGVENRKSPQRHRGHREESNGGRKEVMFKMEMVCGASPLFSFSSVPSVPLWCNRPGSALAAPLRETTPAERLWMQAQARFDETVGVRAIDDRTLSITLREPVPYFLDLLALAVCSPVHRPTVEGWRASEDERELIRKRGWHSVAPPPFADRRWISLNASTGRIEQLHDWCKPRYLVTNGPYVLARWRFKRDMLLEANTHYHQPELMRNQSVFIVNIDDPNTAILAYESGRFDWLSDVSAEYRADMLGDPQRTNIHAFPAFGVDFYQFNCRPALANGRPNPFADPAVRRAFVLATNRDVITRQVTRLNEPVMTTLVPPGSIPGYRSPEGLGYDPERARRELTAAGWINRDGDGQLRNEAGEPFPVVEILWTTNTPRYRWISLELKSQWERELGVRVELRGVDTRFYRDDLRTGNFMVARGTWYGDYGDPTTFLNLCRSDDGNNHRKYSSEYVDALLDDAARERDPEKRMRILERAEAHVFQNDVPMMPICQLMQVYMYEPDELRGLSSHPRLVQYLWQLERTGANR